MMRPADPQDGARPVNSPSPHRPPGSGRGAADRVRRSHAQTRTTLRLALAFIAAAAIAFTMPGATLLAIVIVIGAWAVVRGVFEIAAAVRLRRLIENEWLLGFSGAVSILFALLVLFFPQLALWLPQLMRN